MGLWPIPSPGSNGWTCRAPFWLPHELLDATSLVDSATSLREIFRETSAKFPLLTERARSLADLRFLAAAIRRAILPNGEIGDDASPALRRIREGMARTRENLQKALERILRARGGESGEDYITQRNDRYVIPVRASERRSLDGVVHAASATGQTVFVEPLETIEVNNRLVQLREEEAAEIARILEELTAQAGGRARSAFARRGDDRGDGRAFCAGAIRAGVRRVHSGIYG